ncbi:AAA domain-containing protein [Ephemerocybe angulata]|uniref:DNA replication ATP-dependent helicase/nuclease DNA2 n=1 Tax=Ephemerocybe angulata TaxID=980116 RepID=A0A8H6I7Q1_9AGAR|nr:AAA domain-containing protein [Tulosesus angulatus]
MAGLLQGLDASFEPAPLPAKSRPSPFPSRHHVSNAEAGPSTPGTTSKLIDLTNKASTSSSYQTPKKQRIGNTTLQSENGGPVADVDMDELLAGAEDWDFDDWVPSPKKPSPKKRSSVIPAQPTAKPRAGAEAKAFVPDPYTRCVVDAVGEQLDVRSGKDLKHQQVIYLQNDWYDTDVRPGDIVNAVGPFEHTSSAKPSIKITSQSNLLILHPDILLTATALSNAPQCARKPLLSSLVRASNDISPALVWGNMLHEVMQNCLSEKRWEEEWINEQIEEVLLNGLGMLLALNVSIVTARTELRKRAIGLQIFKERYISDVPKPDAILSDTRARSSDSAALLAIPQLHEIEEDIWSPKYGLKGKVDATVEAVIAETPPASSSPSIPAITSGPRPFEIKTGRSLAGLEHRAQTMLYTLLASERYGTDVPDGLLYYTQSDTVVRVPRSRNEIRGLIVARNALAGYMIKRVGREGEFNRKRNKDEEERKDIEEIGMGAETFLPPPIDDEHACKRCYTVDTCMLYRYAYSAKTSETKLPMLESPPTASNAPESLVNTYDLKTGHLTPEQGLFFRKWETLLSLEERDLVRFRRELWTIGAGDREKKGRCFAGMVVKPLTGVEQDAEKDEKNAAGSSPAGEGRVYKFSYTFVRSVKWAPSSQGGSSESDQRNLLNGHLNVGDPITVSVEPHLLAFAQGFITDLTPVAVKLGIDHKVDLEWIRARMRKDDPQFVAGEVVFRIDKDELFGGMGRMRNNLAQLFYANGDRKRLELVVDLRKPLFSPSIPPESLAIESSSSQHVKNLNLSQKEAVSKVLSAEDYALVLGMPGTGKTTVISALIKILVAQGKTVLLTSYTHSAVDTILRKLDDEADDKSGAGLAFGVLRLGNLEKIHPDVRKYTLSAKRKAETVEQLEAQWMGPPVVAATCLSVKNPLARRGGLEVSLFRRLSDAHPDSVVDLREQYRMNEDIMALSNKLIYSDRLKCGSAEVANRKLVLPNAPGKGDLTWLDASHRRQRALEKNCWLAHLASPETTAVFVDTDSLGPGVAHDSRVGDLVQNEVEAELVVQLVEALVGKWGLKKKDVGVISLYRQQVKLIKSLLLAGKSTGRAVEEEGEEVEVLTADKSQGRDKECVVVSMVRSNDHGQVGELVKDWRRMNVSFTRARSKLVIFGSRKTLKSDPLLAQFFELMEGRGWVYELPIGAHVVHKQDLERDEENVGVEEDDVCVVDEVVEGVRPVVEDQILKKAAGVLKGRPILQDLVSSES